MGSRVRVPPRSPKFLYSRSDFFDFLKSSWYLEIPTRYRLGTREHRGTSTLVTCMSARSQSGPAARKTKIPLKPPAGVAASGVASASAARGKPGRYLGHHPELDGREDGYRSADDHVDRHRGGSLEAQDPGRDQRPQSDDEVQPLFPDRECRKCRDGEHRDHDTRDIRVLRDRPGIESEYPGRKEQKRAED